MMRSHQLSDLEKKIVITITSIAFIIIFVFALYYFGAGSFSTIALQPPEEYLEIQASPDGFPEYGEMWTITVWKVNDTKEPLEGATVAMYSSNNAIPYVKTTDANGQCTFEYRKEYGEDITITASYGNLTSEPYKPIEKYITDKSSLIFSIFSYPIVATILSVLTSFGVLVEKGAYRRIKETNDIVLKRGLWFHIFLLALLVIISVYGIILLDSWESEKMAWGYPLSATYYRLRMMAFTVVSLIVILSSYKTFAWIHLILNQNASEEGDEKKA